MSLTDKRIRQISVYLMKQTTIPKRPQDCERGGETSQARRHTLPSFRTAQRVAAPSRGSLVNCWLWTLVFLHLVVVTTILLSLMSHCTSQPSCIIQWKTKTRSCEEAYSALMQRLLDWSAAPTTCDNCSQYEVVSVDPRSLHLSHRSEWHATPFEADISIVFTPMVGGNCKVLAQSRAHGWPYLLDGGASFCSLVRLASSSSFLGPLASQRTNSRVCTQFSPAACPRLALEQSGLWEPPANHTTLSGDFSPTPPYLPSETGRNQTQSP